MGLLGPLGEMMGALWQVGAMLGGTVADRYASSATQTKPFRDRPTAAARSCALALRAGGHRKGNDVVLIFISI